MIETTASATLPVTPQEAFAAASDVAGADWLPAVRGVRHIGGPQKGVGARFEVEAGFVGRHLRGVLVVRELTPPRRMVLVLEEGLDLTVTVEVAPVRGGCEVRLQARYSVRGGPFGSAVERASQGAARHEVARAVEQFAARFGRETPTKRAAPRR